MSEEFGPDFITVTDEDGNDFELEHLDTLEYNNEVYMAFFPAVSEDAQEGVSLRTKRWRIDRTGSPARCVMGSFKPTFLKRDTPSQRGLQASRLPLRHAGSWKQ